MAVKVEQFCYKWKKTQSNEDVVLLTNVKDTKNRTANGYILKRIGTTKKPTDNQKETARMFGTQNKE